MKTNSITEHLDKLNVYTFRKTGEEIEVIDSYQPEKGARSDEDWVTYIDSNGQEHIKEHLNLQLDFKANTKWASLFSDLYKTPSYSFPKFPSTNNTRYYEIVRDLVVNHSHNIEEACLIARKIVEATKDKYNESEENDTETSE